MLGKAHLLKLSKNATIVSKNATITIQKCHHYYPKSPLLIFGLFF